MIGEKAGIVVCQADEETGRRVKFASAHDLRRGCALRLINAGISAETLKVILRHRDFSTTERFYGATRAAQSAANEIHEKLGAILDAIASSQHPFRAELSDEEMRKLKAILRSI
jgi:integrase